MSVTADFAGLGRRLTILLALMALGFSGCVCTPIIGSQLRGKIVRKSYIHGPEADGEKGSINVVFRGAETPATVWWADTGAKPKDPDLIHPVLKSPGCAVTAFGSGEHILYFATKNKKACAPDPAIVTVSTWKTTVVEIDYKWCGPLHFDTGKSH